MGKNKEAEKTEDVVVVTKYNSVEDAKAQAAEYFGFPNGADIVITVDGKEEIFTVPYPGTLNDDQQERWNRLQFEIEQCDRYPDVVIPDHKLTKRTVVGERTTTEGEAVTVEKDCVTEEETFVPGSTARGQLMQPYRKTDANGETTLLEPTYSARVAIALWGEERYRLFRENGGESRLVSLIQAKMEAELQERQKQDSKSDGRAGAVGEVSETDSDGAS